MRNVNEQVTPSRKKVAIYSYLKLNFNKSDRKIVYYICDMAKKLSIITDTQENFIRHEKYLSNVTFFYSIYMFANNI